MTTTTNIQMADNGTTGKSNNNEETVIMKIQSNIQNIFQSNAKVLVGIVIGDMFVAASMLPGAVSADSSARAVPVSSQVVGIESLYVDDSDLQFPSVRQSVGIESLYANDSDLQFPSVKLATGPAAGIKSLYANDSDLQFLSVKQVTGMGIESLFANDPDIQFPSV